VVPDGDVGILIVLFADFQESLGVRHHKAAHVVHVFRELEERLDQPMVAAVLAAALQELPQLREAADLGSSFVQVQQRQRSSLLRQCLELGRHLGDNAPKEGLHLGEFAL